MLLLKDKEKENQSEATFSSALVSLGNQMPTGAGNIECSLAVVPVQVKMLKANKTVLTYVFLDPGSSATFCTEDLMDQLMANG